MQLTSLPQYVNNAKRVREIVTILARYGLAGWVTDSHPEFVKGLLTDSNKQPITGLSGAQRLRMALTEMGPTFIKLGQILSTRVDLVGPEIADELAQLQSSTPADSPEQVLATVTAELGKPPEELFAEFDAQAMASASIGQVHRATLAEGRPVIVKVQHQGIQEQVTSDLEILIALANLAEEHAPQLRSYQPVATATEFRRTLLRELDFTRELRNLQLFAENFKANQTVHFPTAYPELSGRRVMTMEWLEGIGVGDAEALRESGCDLDEFARRGANMFLDMILRDGFYHADPHPGNLMLLEDGVVGVLDCGMAGYLDDALRQELEDLLFSAVQRDGRELTDIIIRLGAVPPELDRRALQMEVTEFLADYTGQSLEEFDLSGALNGMIEIIRRYQIILPSSCSMLLKVLVMLEGTSRQLDPRFSLAELLQPYYSEALQRRFSPKRLMKEAQRRGRDWDRLLETAPRDLADVLDRVKRGTFDVHLEHRRLEATVNRLVLGILAASLFVGSAQLWSRSAPPDIAGISIFGVLGTAVAAFLSHRLLKAIKRSGDIGPKR